jgi:undecaprenyl-diphosphatase
MLQNIIEIFILSSIQGISEFLPISSSAHLIIVSTLYEFYSSSLLIDVSLHLGSLFAIVFYFRSELFDIKNNQKLLLLIVIGSVPLVIFGYVLFTTGLIHVIRKIEVIAWTTLIFGIVLYFSDRSQFSKKISVDLNLKLILFIGFFQVLSLIPGVSRSGISITAARILKFNRVDSSKISFLLSIPALCGASILSLKDLTTQSIDFNYLALLAVVLSFMFSYITVKFFIIYINKFSMNVFVFYRIFIAIFLFYIIY